MVQMFLGLREESDAAQDDLSQLERLLKHAENCDASTGGEAMQRNNALADALVMAIRLASKHGSSIKETKADVKVQEVLSHASKGMLSMFGSSSYTR